ncbi:MAG: thiamine pyrophosphate-dependent enzyme [Tissierellia bacterium]|nr:thiamine pyrophosphate-dependent enzyme [Tissierellia bacterium]MDD4725235.1 thiamine pyrophosphate-dependent enzyme [Tissierellia bacterium]
MAYNFKEEMNKPERFAGGHRLCAGCGAGVMARNVLRAIDEDDNIAIVNATGCLQAATFSYPYITWEDSWIHSAFENAGATCGGMEAAYRALEKRGKVKEKYKFLAFGGDGGSYDIGFQSLSGAMERNHDMVYICYDNEAYMNTGIQRSSSTSRFTDTTTTPAGSVVPGKPQNKKNLTEIMVAHSIPYVGQTTFLANMKDLNEKTKKAVYTEGPAFLNVLAPCTRGWRYDMADLLDITKAAVETCFWPLFEVENGKYKLTYEPKKKLPIEEYLRPQGRFKHMFKKGNEWMIEEFQKEVDLKWEMLLKKCE